MQLIQKNNWITNILFLIILLSVFKAQADIVANAWQTIPQDKGKPQSSLFYLTDDKRMRIESRQDSRPVIQIYNPILKRSWVIFPKEGTYMESIIPDTVAEQKTAVMPEICLQNMPVTCTEIGDTSYPHGTVREFKIEMTKDNQVQKATQWLDIERGFIIRQQMSNGWVSYAYLIKKEMMNGRMAEKWEFVNVSPQGEKQHGGYQWFDFELKMNIREEYPNGMVRELKDISVEKLSDSLFILPKGLTHIKPQ